MNDILGMARTIILIDGMNLAFRMHHVFDRVQGLSYAGEPTGLIHGFITHIQSWKRRAPGATIVVVWEGEDSTLARKAVYPAYKAGRSKPSEGGDPYKFAHQITRVREMLPLYGVHQASKRGAEADDVIAQIVQEVQPGRQVIIVSTDRDLLTLTCHHGTVVQAKDKVYNAESVQEEYGVPPEYFPHLKALIGDTSDNITGLERFPKKVAASIVMQTRGSVYTDSIPMQGLTALQRLKYEGFEDQYNINLTIVSWDTEGPYDFTEGEYDYQALVELSSQFGLKSLVSGLLSPETGFFKSGESSHVGLLHPKLGSSDPS